MPVSQGSTLKPSDTAILFSAASEWGNALRDFAKQETLALA